METPDIYFWLVVEALICLTLGLIFIREFFILAFIDMLLIMVALIIDSNDLDDRMECHGSYDDY